MKKNLFIALLILTVMYALPSCKKDKTTDPSTQLITEDLLSVYLPFSMKSGQKLRVIYFTKEGNEVKATMDAVSARRALTVNLVNNSFTFDVNGDGKKIYTFTLNKNADGNITLVSANYKNQDDATDLIATSFIYKVSDAPSYNNTDYFAENAPAATFRFLNGAVSYITGGTVKTGVSYEICPGCWKTTISGVDFIGIGIQKKRMAHGHFL